MDLLLEQVDQLIALFQPMCQDVETMTELRALLQRKDEWIKAHYLSARIRAKSINAFKAHHITAEVQYSFEEACAKTLHNLSGLRRPFDADTPYWILPLALKLAKALDIDPGKVLDIAIS
jgi:hypothetical protein